MTRLEEIETIISNLAADIDDYSVWHNGTYVDASIAVTEAINSSETSVDEIVGWFGEYLIEAIGMNLIGVSIDGIDLKPSDLNVQHRWDKKTSQAPVSAFETTQWQDIPGGTERWLGTIRVRVIKTQGLKLWFAEAEILGSWQSIGAYNSKEEAQNKAKEWIDKQAK